MFCYNQTVNSTENQTCSSNLCFYIRKENDTMTNTQKHSAVKELFLSCGFTLLLGTIICTFCLVLDKIFVV